MGNREQPERFDDEASDADNKGKFDCRGVAVCWVKTYITRCHFNEMFGKLGIISG